MFTFMVTLHVLAAVLIIGPFALATFVGHRAILRRDAVGVRDAVRAMRWFAIGSVLVAVLGAGSLGFTDEWSFHSPWITISMTLYVVALGVATGHTVPSLRRAGRLLDGGVLAAPAAAPAGTEGGTGTGGASDGGDGEPAVPATVSATASELGTKEHLDRLAGRIAGSGGIVLALFALITILMAARPFGK